ncbi:MAG: zinc ribbon domain-containing protein [Armatimonadota bacterium]
MICPKCASELPSGAPVCPKCGTIVQENEQAKPAAKPKSYLPYAIAGALLAVIIIALIAKMAFSGKSVTNASQSPVGGPSVTNAPAGEPGGPSVTNAPAPNTPGASVTTAPGKPAPPQDVLDYLEFVKQIESQRQALLKDTSRAVSMQTSSKGLEDMIDWAMDDSSAAKDPLADLKKEIGVHAQNWNTLIRTFDSRRAPAQCAEFAGAYRQGLTTETQAIFRVSSIINGISISSSDSMQQALSQLQQMKSDPNLQGGIDKSVQNADNKLGELSAQLGISKPFDVRKESDAGGSILSGF